MNRRIVPCIFVALFLFRGGNVRAQEIGKHDFRKWAEIVRGENEGRLAGGYAFEVLDHGKIAASGAEGWARAPWEKIHPSVKWTLDKPMGIASVSKTITAVALLKLWEETDRNFSLDSPFWQYVSSVCPQASDDVKKVTIRQLLNHKSGFIEGPDFTNPMDLEKLLTQPLAHSPGTHYAYNNNNFYLARIVIEQIGHVKYTPYVKEHVLMPMGISKMETHFEASEATCAYGKRGTKRPGFPFDWKCEETAGGAGWYASVADVGAFLVGLRDHKVLSPATTDMMYRDKLGWDWSDPGMGKNGIWIWDEGDRPGSRAGTLRTCIFHFPDDVDAVMFINSETDNPPEKIMTKAWTESMRR